MNPKYSKHRGRRRWRVHGDECGTQEILTSSSHGRSTCGTSKASPYKTEGMDIRKSESLIVARKPGNAGRAKWGQIIRAGEKKQCPDTA